MEKYQICTNCVMDTTDSKITFDSNGVCDHCNTCAAGTDGFANPCYQGNRKSLRKSGLVVVARHVVLVWPSNNCKLTANARCCAGLAGSGPINVSLASSWT